MKKSTRSYLLTELGEAQNDLQKVNFLLTETTLSDKERHHYLSMQNNFSERIFDLKELLGIKPQPND